MWNAWGTRVKFFHVSGALSRNILQLRKLRGSCISTSISWESTDSGSFKTFLYQTLS